MGERRIKLIRERPIRFQPFLFSWVILFFILSPTVKAEEYSLQYFMKKISSKEERLSKKEGGELLNQLDGLMSKAQEIRLRLIQAIQTGEMELRYQEGKFWLSKLEEDQKFIELGTQQLKLLKGKPTHLGASIILFKSLKDLSSHFNAYNNVPCFSAWVGDLAPEMELWADPIFYQLFLLPLAHSKEKRTEISPKERRVTPKPKNP